MQEPEDRIASIVYETGEMIHRRLGPGLYESVYRDILAYELKKRGLDVRIEVPVPLVWDELRFDRTYAADIVVDGLGEPDGAAIAVYKNDTKTEIKTHVALEHVAWLLGQSGAMRGAALTKVDSWK